MEWRKKQIRLCCDKIVGMSKKTTTTKKKSGKSKKPNVLHSRMNPIVCITSCCNRLLLITHSGAYRKFMFGWYFRIHIQNYDRMFSVYFELDNFWRRTKVNQKWVSCIKIAINTSILIEMMIIVVAVTITGCLAFFNCGMIVFASGHTHTHTDTISLLTKIHWINKNHFHMVSTNAHRNLTKKINFVAFCLVAIVFRFGSVRFGLVCLSFVNFCMVFDFT